MLLTNKEPAEYRNRIKREKQKKTNKFEHCNEAPQNVGANGPSGLNQRE